MLPISQRNHFYQTRDVRYIIRANKLKRFDELYCETPILLPADSADSDSDSSSDKD